MEQLQLGGAPGAGSEVELRYYPATVELRQSEPGPDSERPTILLRAVVFNQLSDDLGGFRERILPGAFSRSLKSADVRALWNHNSDFVLGRRSAGTLEIEEVDQGIDSRIFPPDTDLNRGFMSSIQRGDVREASFQFRVKQDRFLETGEGVIREVIEAQIIEVSPVAFPAYPQTTAAAKRFAAWQEKRREQEKTERKLDTPPRLDIEIEHLKNRIALLEAAV